MRDCSERSPEPLDCTEAIPAPIPPDEALVVKAVECDASASMDKLDATISLYENVVRLGHHKIDKAPETAESFENDVSERIARLNKISHSRTRSKT